MAVPILQSWKIKRKVVVKSDPHSLRFDLSTPPTQICKERLQEVFLIRWKEEAEPPGMERMAELRAALPVQ